MNEKLKESKVFVPISQQEAAYMPLSGKSGQACANCRFYQSDAGGWSACALISNWPETIQPTGWCNRWEGIPVPEPIEIDPIPVIIVGEMDKGLDTPAPPPPPEAPGYMSFGKQESEPGLFRRMVDSIMAVLKPTASSDHTQFKSLGNGYYVAWYSNNFEDREQEIIAAEAHDRFINRVKSGIVPYPELWFWHIPGSRHGKAIWLDRFEHMVVAIGKFDETPLGKIMQKHYEESGTAYAMSHGFTSDKNNSFRNGVWYDLNTFEHSPLSPDVAANVYTLFSEVKSMVSTQALEALKTILVKGMGESDGQKAYADILGTTETMNKEAEAMGARYKDFSNPAAADALATPEEKATGEIEKSFGQLALEILAHQADTTKALNIQAGQIAQLSTVVTGQDTALKAVQSELSLTPRRASSDPLTELTDPAAAEKLKQLAGEYDNFWADMKVTK